MKKIITLFVIIIAISCKEKSNNKTINNLSQLNSDSLMLLKKNITTDADTLEQDFYILDTLSLESAKFNNKKMFFLLTDYSFKKKDSISYNLWPCGNPFEWMDEKFQADSIKNIYINGAKYITNENSVLLIESKIKNNELSIFNLKKINEFTLIDDFKNIFPFSYKNFIAAKKLNPENYIEYDYINVAFIKEQPEDHWIFYFNKQGYLIRFELYWWLC